MRAALYDLVGTVAMILVVLVFLDDALQIWGLTALSETIGRLIVYLPNLLFVTLIVGIGLLVSNTLAHRVEAIGVAFAVAVGLGSAKAIQRVWESLLEKSKE